MRLSTYISIGLSLIASITKLNTSYFENGNLILDKLKIVRLYIHKYILYDAFAYFGLIYFLVSPEPYELLTKILSSTVFIKTHVLLKNLEVLEEKMALSGNQIHMWTLVKLFAQAFVLCHVVGTFYHLLAQIEIMYMDEEKTWLQNNEKIDTAWNVRYAESFYWAQATIMLVGSKGDTFVETVYCCCALFGTVGMFATILSSVASIMDEIDRKYKTYNREKDVMNNFFKRQTISRNLQGYIMNYMKYAFVGHPDRNFNAELEDVISKFPNDLQELVKIERYDDLVQMFPVLVQNFSKETINGLIDIVEEEYFMPGQEIFQEKEYDDGPKLYLILKGEVNIFQKLDREDKQEVELAKIQVNGQFGEQQFFSDLVPTYYAKSVDFSTILTIKRNKFLDYLRQNDTEGLEKFQMIRDEVRCEGMCDEIYNQCRICFRKNALHSEDNCNLIHYVPKAENIIRKNNISIPVKNREHKKRKSGKVIVNHKANQKRLGHFSMHWKDSIIKPGTQKEQKFNERIMYNSELRMYIKPLQEMMKKFYDSLHMGEAGNDDSCMGHDHQQRQSLLGELNVAANIDMRNTGDTSKILVIAENSCRKNFVNMELNSEKNLTQGISMILEEEELFDIQEVRRKVILVQRL